MPIHLRNQPTIRPILNTPSWAVYWVLSVALTSFPGCRQEANKTPGKAATSEPAVVSGQLATLALQPWPTMVRVQGSLAADEVTTIAAKVAGRVVEVSCDLGDLVQDKQPLVKIDDREYKLRLAQAKSQLSQARAAIGLAPDDPLESLKPTNSPPVREARAVLDEALKQVQRLEPLYQKGTIVANDLEAAQSLAAVAEARYNSAMNSVREKIANVEVQSALADLAQQQLDDTAVPAAFDGLVQRRSITVGSYVQVGQPLLEIAKTDVLRYRASVPERFAQLVHVGQEVKIFVASKEHSAKVTRVSPTLDPTSRALAFEADVPNDGRALRGGLFAQADLVLDDQSMAIVVSPSSLVRFAGVDKVWKVAEGQVREAVVRLGRETADAVEIVEGLAAGDQILVDASQGKIGRYQAEL